MEQTFQPTEKEHEEFHERMIKIIKEQKQHRSNFFIKIE